MKGFKTSYPKERPSFNEWCKEFNFGIRYAHREGINNAQRIMSLWDGFAKTKQIFINLKSGNDKAQ